MLRNRQFFLLWTLTIVSTLGIELFTITILVSIFEETGSTLQAAGAMVTRALPPFLLGPIAGVLVDRYRRQNVIVGMDIVRLILIVVAVWVLQRADSIPILSLYLISAGLAAADVFHRPARIALIPSIVQQADLVRANGLITGTLQISLMLAYLGGGWLVNRFTMQDITLMTVAFFGISILMALLLRIEPREKREAEKVNETVWESFINGWRYMIKHDIARPLTIMETIEHLPHGIWTGAIILTFTLKALNGDATDFGILSTSYFAGMILGSFAALSMDDWLNRFPGRIIIANACLSGLLTLLFATSQTLLISFFIAFIFGPPFAIRDVAQDALLQSSVEEEQLGRIYATREMLRNVVFMFAGLFFAWLSDFIPIRTIYYIGGGMYILTGLYALSSRPLRFSAINRTQKGTPSP